MWIQKTNYEFKEKRQEFNNGEMNSKKARQEIKIEIGIQKKGRYEFKGARYGFKRLFKNWYARAYERG